ncbi:hypothetical protein, variant [Plasmodium falciparum Santa Lucia]|uniref:Dynamin N-terminal domain-containing protein n=8 Tax=Plasmodium falciparum TaxID=5833 RepID=A0A024W828_PLAFA|nr:hypothetical protein, variant [Plasmodium falciparum Vietnam Oak-Knoll (FVO)]ETW37059.1 hypothetical protein, variant [Plasmodium falciparum Tanzania (2000708)]ETW43359.1 hypothetical protein, variant [Plasmodium falciparum NF135/5.C10]ETW49810.1 hypothetical protein, variant [Plasmodium falciparum MaliPS096_E11]ETW52448.1 hypothetical protein, variant [Plasmodium falciparum Palo Alto/Uganda]ETW62015.1 hypothetical protein, variant [Plasmodium falciparum CAMP/Malaysia]EUR72988.1 hypothetic
MESMPSETTINSEQYKSKESNNICRNEKSTAYSENSDISNNKEDYNSDRKENFDKKLCDNMNDKINIYDNIISEIKELYNGNIVMNNKGLDKLNIRNVAKGLFLNINKTISKKVRVLVIGNSSSGKSTFINWFLQENIQKTGYEYETNNFTLITSGNYFSEFNGDITVRTFDFLKQISNRNRNFKNNLCTKMYVSKNMETKNIDFIDTPGLKDIMNKLDFDINSIIYDLSDYVDIILVFFDSSGKSLSNRLLLIIKEIYEKHMEKIIFIFSKIDEIKHEEDRIKLLCQTTQCLTTKINIRHNIDLLPIYIHGAKTGRYLFESNKNSDELCIVNRINDIIYEIKKLFFKKLERDLYCLINDCDSIINKILDILKTDGERRMHKYSLKRERVKHTVIQVFLFLVFMLLLFMQLPEQNYYKGLLLSHFNFGNNSVYIKYIKNTGVMLNNWENSYIMINVILVFFFLLSGIMKKKFSKNIKTLHVSSKEILRVRGKAK